MAIDRWDPDCDVEGATLVGCPADNAAGSGEMYVCFKDTRPCAIEDAADATGIAADGDLELAVGTCMAVVPDVVAVPPRCGGVVDDGAIGECIDFAVALASCKARRGPFAWTCEDPDLLTARCVSNVDGSCTTICGRS